MISTSFDLQTSCENETFSFAEKLADLLQPADVLGLKGELGAGKTCFTKGLVAALDPQQDLVVTSPTFSLLNTYDAEIPVYHFDFYRLVDVDDLETTGFWDVVAARDGIVVVEWIDRIPEATYAANWMVEIFPVDETTRKISVTGPVERVVGVGW